MASDQNNATIKDLQNALTKLPEILMDKISAGSISMSKNPETYNVVDDYRWTNINSIYRGNVPYAFFKEYEIQGSFAVNSIRYWLSQLITNDPYFGLYNAKPTGAYFKFPYYISNHRNISNEWGRGKEAINTQPGESGSFVDVAAKSIELITGVTEAFTGGKTVAYMAGTDAIKSWSGPSLNPPYTIRFNLYNTYSQDDIVKNKRLIDRLIMAQLHDKRSSINRFPGSIFVVEIPGIRYSPASIIQSLTINNLGHMGTMAPTFVEPVPDAWEVELSVQDLIPESRQIFQQVSSVLGKRTQIRSMVSSEEFPSTIKEGIQKIKEFEADKLIEQMKMENTNKNNET